VCKLKAQSKKKNYSLSERLIHEFCDLQCHCHVKEVGKTRENNLNKKYDFSNWLIACEQDQRKIGNLEP
jgi:hypothetical protein